VDNACLDAQHASQLILVPACPALLEHMPLQIHSASYVQLAVLHASLLPNAQHAKKVTNYLLILALKVVLSHALHALQT
jgi:hypothetical protein